METLFSGSKANLWKSDLLWERWFALGISCKCFVNVLNLKCDSSDLLRQGWFALGILTDESPLPLICINHKNLIHENFDLSLEKYINNCNRSLSIITFFSSSISINSKYWPAKAYLFSNPMNVVSKQTNGSRQTFNFGCKFIFHLNLIGYLK